MYHEQEWESNVQFQKALWDFLSIRNLSFDGKMRFESMIDAVCVHVNDNEVEPVLIIGLPPVSNYNVIETEHTSKYAILTSKTIHPLRQSA